VLPVATMASAPKESTSTSASPDNRNSHPRSAGAVPAEPFATPAAPTTQAGTLPTPPSGRTSILPFRSKRSRQPTPDLGAVELTTAKGPIKRRRHNLHFLKLLHPERAKVPRKKSDRPRERMLVTPPQFKMWPWMRDLDVRLWIGRGWMLTPEGITRLTETGAAPGTQVFEGFGQLPAVRRKRGLEEQLASGSAAEQGPPEQGIHAESSVLASSGSSSSASRGAAVGGLPVSAASHYASGGQVAAGQGVGLQKRVISVRSKQSGVPGITWHKTANGWAVSWRDAGKRKDKYFPVHRYMLPRKSMQEADAEALRDAVACRKGLVDQGKIKVSAPLRTTGIRGVCWHTGKHAWEVRYNAAGKKKAGGTFKPKDDTAEDIERARLAAVECRRRLELEHYDIHVQQVPDPSQLKKLDSGVTGVVWNAHGEHWHVQIVIGGKKVNRRFRPKDSTPEEIEVARLAAVACRKDLESQRATLKT